MSEENSAPEETESPEDITDDQRHTAHIQTLGAVINQAIANHTRGTALTYAELIGTLEMVKSDFIDQAKRSAPVPKQPDDNQQE